MIYLFDKISKQLCITDELDYTVENNNNLIVLTSEQFKELMSKKNNGYNIDFKIYDDGNVFFEYTFDENLKSNIVEFKKNKLRNKRNSLLEAFDKYKTNVNYGIVVEDEETRAKIVSWYSDLLNLVETAFEEDNIPSEIKYYL